MAMPRTFMAAALSFVLLGDAGTSLAGDDELPGLVKALRAAEQAADRRMLATKLSLVDTRKAALELARLVSDDADVGVRLAAAEGLGRMSAPGTAESLVDLIVNGNATPVRRGVAVALGRHDDGPALLRAALASPRLDGPGRLLLVQAMGALPGKPAREALRELALAGDRVVRPVALRALCSRTDLDDGGRSDVLKTVLGKHRDVDTLLAALDALEEHPDDALLPAVETLESFLDPVLQEAVAHMKAVLLGVRAAKAARAAADDGYGASPRPPGDAPPARPRIDLVFALDSTGSVTGLMNDIRRWILERHRFLVDLGSDVRVGIVAYRDDIPHLGVAASEVLPLTGDMAIVDAFLDALKPKGADAQGAAASLGLRQAMDRMVWRANATRFTWLIADSKCPDVDICRRIMEIHRAADGTRLRVAYLLRTRGSVPDSVLDLAKAARTPVEILK